MGSVFVLKTFEPLSRRRVIFFPLLENTRDGPLPMNEYLAILSPPSTDSSRNEKSPLSILEKTDNGVSKSAVISL